MYVLWDINILFLKITVIIHLWGGLDLEHFAPLYRMILTLMSKAVCQPRSVGVLKPTKSNAVVAV